MFRITAQQQRNINVTFPKKNVRGDNPRDVSIIGGTRRLSTFGYEATGDIMVRFAAPDNWLDRKDYQAVLGLSNATSNYCANLATEPNSQFEETSYRIILTNHTTGQQGFYSVNTTHTGNIIDLYRVTSNTSNLPRFESPLTFDHRSMRLSLRVFNPDAGGQGVSGTYTAQVFPTTAEMGQYNPNDPLLNDPNASNYSNSALIVNRLCAADIMLVGGGGAGGRIYNIAANSNYRFGSGSGGGGGVLIGYNVPLQSCPSTTYNIKIGQGGDPTGASAGEWNGGGTSAFGCYVPGGGHGAWMDFVNNSAGPNMLAAGNGGCGGGSVSRDHVSLAGKIAGRAGLSTISASSTMVVGGMYELYGFPGGRFPGHNNLINESNANANGLEAASANSIAAYHLGYPNAYGWRKHVGSFDNNSGAGGVGGAAGAYGASLEAVRDGCPGVYISWATPDIAHLSVYSTPKPVSSSTGLTIPQLNTVPYISFVANRWTGDQNSPRNNSQRGYYGGSGSSESAEGPGKGGGGIGQFLATTAGLQSTNLNVTLANGFSFTHSADGVHGTGGGGGALYSDRNSNNTGALSPGDYVNGGKGGNGIVLLRIPQFQEYRTHSFPISYEDKIRTADGHYTIYVFRTDGTILIF